MQAANGMFKKESDDLRHQIPRYLYYSSEITNQVSYLNDDKLELKDFLKLWQEQNRYIAYLESKLKINNQSRVDRMEQLLISCLNAKEREFKELSDELIELKAAQARTTPIIKSTLVEPTINLVAEKIKIGLAMTQNKLKQAQEEIENLTIYNSQFLIRLNSDNFQQHTRSESFLSNLSVIEKEPPKTYEENEYSKPRIPVENSENNRNSDPWEDLRPKPMKVTKEYPLDKQINNSADSCKKLVSDEMYANLPRTKRNQSTTWTCYYCGGLGHKASECTAEKPNRTAFREIRKRARLKAWERRADERFEKEREMDEGIYVSSSNATHSPERMKLKDYLGNV